MKITVKILLGEECTLEVASDLCVLELKKFIEGTMHVPVGQQKLLLSGKTLHDDKKLSEYSIKEGTKLNLVVRKDDPANVASTTDPSLRGELHKVLRKFFNEPNANRMADEFMRQFHSKLATLSLDDIERIATSYLRDEQQEASEQE